MVAPLVDAVAPVVQSVTQTAGAVIGVISTTTDAVAPALSPVLAPVDSLLQRVPGTLTTVTSALPRLALSLDDTVGTVADTVHGVPVSLPARPAPQGQSAVPTGPGAPGSAAFAALPPAAPVTGANGDRLALMRSDEATGRRAAPRSRGVDRTGDAYATARRVPRLRRDHCARNRLIRRCKRR